MNQIEIWENKRRALQKFLASLDVLELLDVSKDVSDALKYRANVEETIHAAHRLANKAVS
jgi:hypothetical protein